MLEEQVVSFKVAKLAWEKGFRDTTGKWRGKSYYNYKGELNGDVIDQLKPANRNNPKFDSVAAPTQSLLQKWLRDKHSIHISLFPNDDVLNKISWEAKLYETNFNNEKEVHYLSRTRKGDTYEESLEAGLFEALNLIDK